MPRFGLVRVATASPAVAVGNPERNVDAMLVALASASDADVIVFPELSLTGYTAADLFAQHDLLRGAQHGLLRLAEATRERTGIVIVGLPLAVGDSLYNVAAVLHRGRCHGFVPKQYLPTYREYYESRWFRAADGSEPQEVDWLGGRVPFGIDLLFDLGCGTLGIEICEDLWMPAAPSGFQALAGAELLVNLSASTEAVGKSSYRQQLVLCQSGRCIAGYVYAGASATESTTDVVFAGHSLIAENGVVVAESPPLMQQMERGESPLLVAELDLERLRHDRRVMGTFAGARAALRFPFRKIPVPLADREWSSLSRGISATPFVPSASAALDERCAEIFAIQVAGLAKRVSRLPQKSPLVIGVSGGLDSTLALLAAVRTCDTQRWPRDRILALTMPGFGTSEHTRTSGTELLKGLGVRWENIDIRGICLDLFRALDHAPLGIDWRKLDSVEQAQKALQEAGSRQGDLVFENVQARVRTLLLMSRGFVLGTGDMSEQALGWSTYNGDHMSMYNVNTSVPKTLVRFLVRYAADRHFDGATRKVLHRIADTPISPELLPLSTHGEIVQKTEDTIGPYELNDFFLFHVVRNGFQADKIRFLAKHAKFSQPHTGDEIARALDAFYRRFFANQFKRSCVPDGPKVGTVSLSPRGDWRMPSDADPDAWIAPPQDGN